jgi:RND family efflux transporter MFP subunit
LANLKSGPDALDLRSQELSVQQKQNTLADAQQKLANYTVRASIDGTIAQVSAKKGDVASSGSSIATLISTQQIVEISLNEVDISKVKVGQKAVLTFDAIEGLTITGTVADMDSIGTATQGVVNYAVKISFDTQDDQVKPGMSVSASIITDIRQDALLIPNSAVKSQGETTYVEILENGKPKSQTVQIGIANDSSTEIISGVNEGQQVVTQIITTNTTTKTNTQTKSQGIGIPGLGGDGPR